jgi:class 3 adenylate cyclase
MSIGRPAERRLVTCLFIDVVGSTELGTRLGPERMRRVLDDAFAEISARAVAEGGTVEKYIGDEVFVLFGAPVAHHDDAVRALRVALGCAEWARTSGTPISVRAGVETGEALVDLASLETRQRMAVGACVNVAARLQQHAAPGDVLVGATCVAAAERNAAFEPLGELELKGVGAAQAWRLVRLADAAAPPTPFLGRDAELDTLRAALDDTARGRASFVLVSGEPGIGKTRLVDEFVRHVGQSTSVLRARCRPGTEVGAKTPLRQLVGEQQAADLPAAVAHAVGLSSDPRLLALATFDRQNEIDTAWREYLGALAGGRPLVICIEDVHWAEPETVHVLDRVTFRNDAPLMVVATARPDFAAVTAVRPGEGRVVVELPPLDPGDASALARSAGARDLDGIERAAGNPLFILELSRGGASGSNVPLTLQAAIAARLDELARDDSDLLQRVSIVGDSFTVRDAALLSDRGPAEVAGMLGRLVHLRYVEAVERGFRFHHVLLRDVAYGRLPANTRLRLHAQYASVGLDPDDVEALAHHWWEALGHDDAEWVWSDAEREAFRAEALRAHVAAGQRLADRLAAERMVMVFERALRLARDPREQATVEEALGLAYARNANGEEATLHRLRAIELLKSAQGSAPAKLYADALDLPVFNWGYFHHVPDAAAILALIDDGIAAARDSGDDLALLRLLNQRALFANDLSVIPQIDRVLAAAAEQRQYADALWRVAFMHAGCTQDVRRALEALDRSFALAASGGQFNEPEALMWRCLMRFHAGDLDGADDQAHRLERIGRSKSTHTQQHALGTLALVAFGRGDWAALSGLDEALRAMVRATPDASFCLWGVNLAAFGAVASVIQRQAISDDLEAFAAQLVEEAPSMRAAALFLPLVLAERHGDEALARTSYDPATRITDRQGLIDLGGVNMAIAAVVRGRWDEAERWLPRLDAVAARGGRLAAAVAAGIREEMAHARGGPPPAHRALRELGYFGLSELLSYRVAPSAVGAA